jgi:outer membrane protein TolC
MTAIALLLLLLAPVDTLDLAAAHRLAELAHPRQAELTVEHEIGRLRDENLRARYLPALSASGQATYNSDVPALPVLPGMPSSGVPHDQYRVALGAQQLIYDAGITAAEREIQALARDAALKEVEVDLFAVRSHVNARFFAALGLQARDASLRLMEDDLSARLSRAEVQAREGALLESVVDVLKVERLRVRQQRAELEASRRSALRALGDLIGRPLVDITLVYDRNDHAYHPDADIRRREIELFDLNRQRLAASASLSHRLSNPTVSGFAEAAYGRPPGTNFFDDSFRSFYTAGVRVNWSPWTWGSRGREREIIALQVHAVDAREAEFRRAVQIAANDVREEIARLEEQLRFDDEIVDLRRRISAAAATRLDHGAITATDFLIERNATLQAELQREQHRIDLAYARARYLTILGHDIR